ncbi:response regulator [Fimbriimonas ginsengisoli]|uniref:Sigma-54 dependent transcriptional regulator n=1 Tax=Fimbriimonas ginsengisoli Gsoil 348 TaxID=661478 RepID=A0A068NV39_FIMGI|nr:response regulator [Fimbriimonas ginsengisoli]AIE87232.1 sigma-54 dependent transcriptional regulator [Fimbriimonas ginsengisoli Gsoil 348]
MSASILVIDDETNIRTMIRLALAHAGYNVETASDGPEGLAKYENGAKWDLVLLDQRMPGMPGIEVQREIFRRNPHARLILITAFGTIDLALEAIQAGASDFLRKPFTAETLRLAVQSALARQTEASHTVPVGMVCREFTRTTINGFSFELESQTADDHSGDMICLFDVHRAGAPQKRVKVVLPAYVMELVKAYTDAEEVPGGERFWIAMCEESLANHLWQNAEVPADDVLRIEDLSTSLQRWLDSVMTVSDNN